MDSRTDEQTDRLTWERYSLDRIAESTDRLTWERDRLNSTDEPTDRLTWDYSLDSLGTAGQMSKLTDSHGKGTALTG
ncbi:hypothetical protein DPMN_024875 [Dreissena polymorpha]|uniref:Uncharacterized protein n=1 Tax=Dreissena polymorpha TaxID=45954 RepID=A0A9D4LPZ4_DREPO|nr:hypothetical protein DPMN_024875 [Dreissena polymorpha]